MNHESENHEQEQLQKDVDTLLTLVHEQAAQNAETAAQLLLTAQRIGPQGTADTLATIEGLLHSLYAGAQQLQNNRENGMEEHEIPYEALAGAAARMPPRGKGPLD